MSNSTSSLFLDRFDEWASPSKTSSVETAVDRLTNGESPAELCRAVGWEPLDLIAALAVFGLGPRLDSLGPKLVQTPPPRPDLIAGAGAQAIANLLPRADSIARLRITAGLLQILDFWVESHQAAQQADDLGDRGLSSHWHAIAHRREPDPGNASYWYRRLGKSSVLGRLAETAAPLLVGQPDSVARLRTDEGDWNPFAFVDLCSSRPETAVELVCRRLQRLEMLLLLDASCASI